MNNLFGTDGIRNRVGREPLTSAALTQCGHALAAWALKKYGPNPRLLISHDTRSSAHWIMAALQAGLLLYPVTVHYADVMPTPSICKLLQLHQFHAGIIISASHNAAPDNGLKIIDGATGKLTAQEEQEISAYYYQPVTHSYNHFGNIHAYTQGSQDYAHDVLSHFEPRFLSHLKIVLDCANGATYKIAPYLFSQLGADVLAINNLPNGTNINDQCGTLHMRGLQDTVIKHNANIGFAFDGDGDRVLIATRHGQIKNGDDILALLSNHPRYKNESTIVGTIMSNHGLDVYLQEQNKKLVRTDVGDKYVAEYLEKNNGLLGGEQSGHIILHDYLQTGDGMVTALRLMEQILNTGDWSLETFTKFPQVLINIPIGRKKDLNNPTIAHLIAQHKAQLNAGRLVIRYSGTENVLRIMVEDREEKAAHTISNNLAHALQKELQ